LFEEDFELYQSDLFQWDHREFLLLLLHSEAKKLVLDSFETGVLDCTEHLSAFLSQVVSKAPNLQILSFGFKNRPGIEKELLPDVTKTSILKSIVKLSNLKNLNLSLFLELDNEDLILVTKNLKNLVRLEVFNLYLKKVNSFSNFCSICRSHWRQH